MPGSSQADLAAVGDALFGPRWQTPLAGALGVSDRTVRRWASGQRVPAWAWAAIGVLCRARGAALIRLADETARLPCQCCSQCQSQDRRQ